MPPPEAFDYFSCAFRQINDRFARTARPISPSRAVRSTVLVALLIMALTAGSVHAQEYGLQPSPDTLTQSILIHPPIDATEDGFFLSTREHTYDVHLRLGD